MAYTGYLIIQYIDDNPNSSGYGETWTVRVADSDTCPSGEGGGWSLISSECEMTTSGFTGYRINTYYNNVSGEYSSTTVADADCQESASTYDTEEIWVNSGSPYCEVDEDGIYTGWGIQLQVQKNFNLPNYGEIKKERVTMSECSGYTEPQWEDISTNCHYVADELTCYLKWDGTADILQIDVNPSSPTFNQTRTINEESEECFCEACDRVDYEWRFVDDICGIQMPSRYDLTGLTDDTVYHVYQKYGRCIIDDQPTGRLQPMNEYSAVTYQTDVEDCLYRWIDTEETVCSFVPSIDGKFKLYFTGGTYSAACDATSAITKNEVRASVYDWYSLTDVEIGDCVTKIGEEAFYWGENLTGVSMPDSVTEMETWAFAECHHLKSIGLSNNLTTLGNDVFAACIALEYIVFPDSITSFGSSILNGCTNLKSVKLPNNFTIISDSFFAGCYSLSSVTIPNSVTSIGNSAFWSCSGLTSINIPSGVTSIGDNAFWGCSGLTSVTVNATTPPTLGSSVFVRTNSNLVIYVPSESVDAYKAASNWIYYASRITAIPNS